MVDAILIIMYLMLAATVGTLVYSVIHSVRVGGRAFMRVNGIPVGKISFALFVALLVVFAGAFVLGSSDAITVNGKPYDEWGWLKMADMFIYTSGLMIFVATALVIYGLFRRRGNVRK